MNMGIMLLGNSIHVLSAMPGSTLDSANLPALCYGRLNLADLPVPVPYST